MPAHMSVQYCNYTLSVQAMIYTKRKWNKLEHLVLKVSLYVVHQLDRYRIYMKFQEAGIVSIPMHK